MSTQANQRQKRMYAVAVRDDGQLYVFLTICRGPHGDVYVNFPRDNEPLWKPHSSYHASGQHHQTSFGHKAAVRHRQKPDASFQNTENVVTTGIACNEPRAINTLCYTDDFQDVFELSINELGDKRYDTYVSVDITDTNKEPTIVPGAKIVRQAVFCDAVPWIVATLFDIRSTYH